VRRIKNLKRRSKDQYCYLSKLLLSIFTLPILLFCSSSSHVFASRLRVSFTPSFVLRLSSYVFSLPLHHTPSPLSPSYVLCLGLHFWPAFRFGLYFSLYFHPASCSHSSCVLLPFLHFVSAHIFSFSPPPISPSHLHPPFPFHPHFHPHLYSISISVCICLRMYSSRYAFSLTPYSVLRLCSSAYVFVCISF